MQEAKRTRISPERTSKVVIDYIDSHRMRMSKFNRLLAKADLDAAYDSGNTLKRAIENGSIRVETLRAICSVTGADEDYLKGEPEPGKQMEISEWKETKDLESVNATLQKIDGDVALLVQKMNQMQKDIANIQNMIADGEKVQWLSRKNGI